MSTPIRKLSALGGLATLLLSMLFIGTAEAAHVGCGSVITASTTLDSDIGPCPGDGIIIGADNITLNLNGHEIFGTTGPGDGNQAGIRLPFRTGVSVVGQKGNAGQAGTVRDFDAGVLVNGGSANTIVGVNVHDNIGPQSDDAELGDGIALFHSARNRIINNSVVHNGPFDGIALLGVDTNDNTIMGNTVEKTVGRDGGNPFQGGEGTGIIINNFLEPENPRRGESIFNNRVIGNLVRGNANSGVSNSSNVGGRIVNNKVEDNGIIGDVCFDFGRRRCLPFNGPSNGIGVQAGRRADQTTSVLVVNNEVSGNVGNGISVSSQDNQITGNVAVGNGVSSEGDLFNRVDLLDRNFRFDENGQLIRDCDRNVWRGNAFNTAFPECAANGAKGSTGRVAKEPRAGTDGQDETISSRRAPRL